MPRNTAPRSPLMHRQLGTSRGHPSSRGQHKTPCRPPHTAKTRDKTQSCHPDTPDCIQQTLIEKFWIALMAYNPPAPVSETRAAGTRSSSSSSGSNVGDSDSSESSSSSECDSDGGSDDVDLSELNDSFLFVNRFDLLSVVSRGCRSGFQSDEVKEEDEGKEKDENLRVNGEISEEEKIRENEDNAESKREVRERGKRDEDDEKNERDEKKEEREENQKLSDKRQDEIKIKERKEDEKNDNNKQGLKRKSKEEKGKSEVEQEVEEKEEGKKEQENDKTQGKTNEEKGKKQEIAIKHEKNKKKKEEEENNAKSDEEQDKTQENAKNQDKTSLQRPFSLPLTNSRKAGVKSRIPVLSPTSSTSPSLPPSLVEPFTHSQTLSTLGSVKTRIPVKKQQCGSPTDGLEATAGGVDDICLEECVKEAVLGLLQELPKSYLQAREHNGELLNSISSLAESLSRPVAAHASALAALLAAHAPSRQNTCNHHHIAHLSLYLGLKSCCRLLRGSSAEPRPAHATALLTPLLLRLLQDILTCEGSFDRLLMSLLLGGMRKGPDAFSCWYFENDEDEDERTRDLHFVLENMKRVKGVRVSEVLSQPLWCCGSPPLVVAAMADRPALVLTLLQHGAGHDLQQQQQARCGTNGVYLAIIILIRKLQGEWSKAEGGSGVPPSPDLLTWAHLTPTAACLRYLLRAVPRVPGKLLRDQITGSDPTAMLPRHCCRDPPSLLHLSRIAVREVLRARDLLPQGIDDLDIPAALHSRLALVQD